MQEFYHVLPQILVDGLTLGFVYAVVALGYTMVYGVLELINFAHSEVFMVGAFAGTEVLLFLQAMGYLQGLPAPVALLVALIIAMVLSGLLGVAIERIAYRPVRMAPRLVPFISAIGVSFFLQDAVRLVEGLWKNAFYLTAPTLFTSNIALSANLKLPVKSLIVILAAVVMMIGLHLFVTRSKWGKAMRAVAQDKPTSALMAINVDRVIALTFFIGAGLGGAAGTLFAAQYSLVHPYVGFILGIKAFTAAVLGGIGNIPGAMLGGVLLGLLESFGAAFLGVATNGAMGAEYKDVFAFVILIAVLIFKPSGLLGEAVREKI
ncbi:branched-chain amino acid ABC transporter permease [Desulforudis sp. 1088]|uniref:branched-chain amino acid ABC transporter permease n=1 Tax=unclassified Candidatus Desulforudis TaxID=2635950 RepID=UPI00348CC7BA